jgi:hypothetical protein
LPSEEQHGGGGGSGGAAPVRERRILPSRAAAPILRAVGGEGCGTASGGPLFPNLEQSRLLLCQYFGMPVFHLITTARLITTWVVKQTHFGMYKESDWLDAKLKLWKAKISRHAKVLAKHLGIHLV